MKSFKKRTLKKFTPRAERKLLRCRSVIIFPLMTLWFLGDGTTARNQENTGSHLLSYKNLFVFTIVTVGLNPDCLYLPVCQAEIM